MYYYNPTEANNRSEIIMKTLNEMQKLFITSSALNAGKTMEQVNELIAAKEIEINKPKKPAYNWSNFNESDNGMM